MGTVNIDTILARFPDMVHWHSGDKSATAHSPCSAANPVRNGLCFCPHQQAIENCLSQGVSILVVPPSMADVAMALNAGSCAVLISDDLQAAMAKLNSEFFLPHWGRTPFGDDRIHPSANIHASARLHDSVVVYPHAVIGPDVSIEELTVIGANTTLEGNISIGKRCFIKSNVFVGHSVEIGDDCRVEPQTSIGTDGFGYGTDKNGQHFAKPHFGKVILRDRVEIGCGVHIDRGTYEDTVIGQGTKIDNHCHFAHNTTIGKDCLITAGFIVAGSSDFGDNCIFAGRVSANGHISVCSDVTMGPVSVISKNISKSGMYGGFPPVPYKDFIKNQAASISLYDMRKSVNKLLSKADVKRENDES
jgi:UDP-3-O-[3-hydroxymyristoyl] glucosamine N-acyltransferase